MTEPNPFGSLKIKVINCAWQDYENQHNQFASTHKVVSTQTHITDNGHSILSVIYYKE